MKSKKKLNVAYYRTDPDNEYQLHKWDSAYIVYIHQKTGKAHEYASVPYYTQKQPDNYLEYHKNHE